MAVTTFKKKKAAALGHSAAAPILGILYSHNVGEVEFCELRLEGVLESGNSKPYSSKLPKGFKLTSPR
jgi:hypothetical protein